MRSLHLLSGIGAVLVLTVVAASAAIRLGGDDLGTAMTYVRGVHRAAASLAAVVVLLLLLFSLKKRLLRKPASAALALTIALSIVGWITGTNPPLAAALFNQLGGFALAGMLAWISGRADGTALPERKLAVAAIVLAGIQAAFGGALALLTQQPPVPLLVVHAAFGLAVAAAVAALGWRYAACAVLAPLLGAAAAVLPAFAAQAAHALAAALLVAAAAQRLGRTGASA